MEILCLGLNHRTAPVELRERFAVSESEQGTLAAELGRQAGLFEGVVVSTCNRVEFYLAAEDPQVGFASLQSFLRTRGLHVDGDAFFRHHGTEGIRHLFRVSSGLDSMVLGETEILGQVKKAYTAAQEAKATSKHLNKLFQKAFNVAKDIRTNTNITRGSVSVGSAAVELAEQIFGRLANCTVMILGAGEMSELMAGALQARGVKSIFVANRSYDRAQALAAKMNGKAVHFDQWPNEFQEVDILIGSTSAPHHVLTRLQLEPIMAERPARPLFCIDLAVPRDIDPAVNRLDGVYLYDIDSLQAIANKSIEGRRRELVVCEDMIDRHVNDFVQWMANAETFGGRNGGNKASGGSPDGSPAHGV
ncbi:MAG: glutamyl-tRNA reductase [Verrucomicrobiota bacterium]